MNERQEREFAKLKEVVKGNPGWELLSTSYVNSRTKLDFKCPKTHIRKMTSNIFKNGTRCAICSGFDPDSVKEKFEGKV